MDVRRAGRADPRVCTGAMLLSAAGLTGGRPCTTHERAEKELRSDGGLVKDTRVVDDRDLVTSGGVTWGIDLALWPVQRRPGPISRCSWN
ncbi:DJ-1/PfpI family protein [Streptomyces sp. ET3-23]|uniref:DJ-1/PfpI family protein n=1 Tax=Streptomyces sp. ET3-23 TaxID=2885643 RepID=UPI0027E1C0F1|nr:DJ-1/PfpI family protein [Streptomyces sp. ET3-23]